jgi:hypothetical protein
MPNLPIKKYTVIVSLIVVAERMEVMTSLNSHSFFIDCWAWARRTPFDY